MTDSLMFAREPFSYPLFMEMRPLLEQHWQEIAHYPDIPLDIDDAVYAVAAVNGTLRIYTVREPVDGAWAPPRLVGYAIFFVRANPHYASSVQASQDVIYVAPACRGATGAKLIRFADDALRAEGVQAVYHHVKVAHNWGRLLERMGYEPVDVIYAKRLDQPAPSALPDVSWMRGHAPAPLDVDQLEAAMLREPQIPIEPVHRFADGLYAREITIPAGTLLTGKIHRARHLNIISRGDISVWTAGEPVRRIRAPFTFIAEPGTRRVGFTHEETVWTTVHATAATDVAAAEAELIEPHDNPYLASPEAPCLL